MRRRLELDSPALPPGSPPGSRPAPSAAVISLVVAPCSLTPFVSTLAQCRGTGTEVLIKTMV